MTSTPGRVRSDGFVSRRRIGGKMGLVTHADPAGSAAGRIAVPAVIAGAGEHVARRFLEFFAASIPQPQHAHGLLSGRLFVLRMD